ncbi:MAG: hypothetical protein WAN65_01315 [Candidatus Sulfotelmatobacter sp.]
MFRMKFIPVVMTAILLSASAFAGNSSTTFETIGNPADPTFNQLLGIDNNGVISGYFGSGAAGHPNRGYTIAQPYDTFVPDNLPGSVQTQATGIANNGTTVGFWSPTNTGTDTNFGFIREANGFTYLSVNNPLAAGSPEVNQLLGINQSNIAVGFYNDADGASHGYAYSVKTGVFTPVNVTNAVSDAATGINSNNLICGFFTNSSGRTLGFLKLLTGGKAIVFSVPGMMVTQFLGVNDSGVAVGFYADSNGLNHGVVYNPVNGQWVTVDDPSGVNGTVLNGINDNNNAVGFYTDAANNTHGTLVTGVE